MHCRHVFCSSYCNAARQISQEKKMTVLQRNWAMAKPLVWLRQVDFARSLERSLNLNSLVFIFVMSIGYEKKEH